MIALETNLNDGDLRAIQEQIGEFPSDAIRRAWANAGLPTPAQISHGFEKVFLLMKLLTPDGMLCGRSVIDFGCGMSAFVSQAANLGMTSTGIDNFEECGGHCKAMADLLVDQMCERKRPRLICGDVVQDPIPDNGCYDFATSMGMMEHIFGADNRQAVISRMVAALRPGGWLILICGPNRRFPIDFFHYGPRYPFLHSLPVTLRRGYLALFAGKRNRDPRFLTGMSVSELEASMRAAGASEVHQLFPMWVRLARQGRVQRYRRLITGAAAALTTLRAEPVIVLAARKSPGSS